MSSCRCEVTNVMSGDVAVDYRGTHLTHRGADGLGRTVLGCDESDVEWIEEREPNGYGEDVVVLRRRQP